MRVFQGKIERPFKIVGKVPGIRELVQQVEAEFDLSDADTITTERVFAETHRLVAITPAIERYVGGPQRHSTGTRSQKLFELAQPQIEWLKTLYPTAEPFIVQVATLPTHKDLLWHIDCYLYQSISHKIHIPLITNPSAYYEYMQAKLACKVHFNVGTAYEINNIWMHRSSNSGPAPRSHLIIDMVESEPARKFLADDIDIIFTHHEENKRTEVEYWN